MKAAFRSGRLVSVWLAGAAVLAGQSGSGAGAPGQFSGPNVLSRFSRLPGGGVSAPTKLRPHLIASYGYLDGLNGPVTIANGQAVRQAGAEASHNLMLGGGISLNHVDKRSATTLGYLVNHTSAYASSSGYDGFNQDLNLNYERQVSRRWGFYTGHTMGIQSNILGVSRANSQSNLFDQAYSAANEALDARLRFFNSGAGFYFQKSSRLVISGDGGGFAVSRASTALVSSRGERAQAEVAYRTSRSQSIGAIYSFSHFYFLRSFGESYVHSAMLSYTRRLNRHWHWTFSGGPYISQSERLRTVQVDPFIANLTGNPTTVVVFKGTNRGVGISTSLNGTYHSHTMFGSYRRAIDPGNGVTLTSLSNFANFNYGYQTTRSLSLGFSLFAGGLTPQLAGPERNADFQSHGGNFTMTYRLMPSLYATSNIGVHRVAYTDLVFKQLRKVATIGIAFSPGDLPLRR